MIDILKAAADRQPILGQTNAPTAQVSADLLMLQPIKAIGIEQRVKALALVTDPFTLGQHVVEQGGNRTRQRGIRATGRAKAI